MQIKRNIRPIDFVTILVWALVSFLYLICQSSVFLPVLYLVQFLVFLANVLNKSFLYVNLFKLILQLLNFKRKFFDDSKINLVFQVFFPELLVVVDVRNVLGKNQLLHTFKNTPRPSTLNYDSSYLPTLQLSARVFAFSMSYLSSS